MAGVCTGPGPCSTKPLGPGPNWVTKADPVNGLGPYIRAIANALRRSGHSEQDAVRLAVGVVKRWAAGGGNVTAPTRARAAKAVAEWEALRAKSKSHNLSNAITRSSIVKAARAADKIADPKLRNTALSLLASNAKKLGMQASPDGDFDKDAGSTDASIDVLGKRWFPDADSMRRAVANLPSVPPSARPRLKAVIRHRAKQLGVTVSLSRSTTMPIDLAAEAMAARMMPDRAHLIAVAKKVEKWPEGPRKANMKRVIAARAKVLHVEPDGDGDFDGDVPSKVPGGMGYAGPALSRADGSPDAAERKAALAKGEALPPLKKGGEPRFPVDKLSLFKKAVHMVQLSASPDPTVRRFLMAVARKRRWTAAIPANWASDGSLKANP